MSKKSSPMIWQLNILFLATMPLMFSNCKKEKNGGGATPTPPSAFINGVSKFEGNSNSTFDFKVHLTHASNQIVKLDYTTQDVSAKAGEDYVATSGTLTINPGSLEAIISVTVLGDTIKEPDEEFDVVLSNPVNCQISTAIAKGTIRNDDTFVPTGTNDGYTTPLSYPGYVLKWQDEFNGPNIDLTAWTHELGAHGWGNNELQNYTASAENSYISNGALVIEAKEVAAGQYTSARMVTMGKKEFRYGRVDIRAKLPYGKGIWPALWMLGANFKTIGWPKCGEIDIMEMVGHEPSKVHGTAHWGNPGHASYGQSKTLSSGTFADEYHVFSIVWDSKNIKWYLDDVLYVNLDITPSGLSAFQNEFFFIFNVAVGGNWPGYPNATTKFPQRLFIDYIRVFQQN